MDTSGSKNTTGNQETRVRSEAAVVSSPKTALDNLETHELLQPKRSSKRRTTTHLKAFAPPKDQVAQRNANVLVENLAMSFRSVVVSENPHGPDDSHTRRISRDEDHTLLLVNVGIVRITLAHDNMDLRPRVSGSTDPPVTHDQYLPRRGGNWVVNKPFTSIDDDLISFLPDGRADIRRIRRRDCGVSANGVTRFERYTHRIVPSWRKRNESFHLTKAPTTASVVRGFRTWPEPLFRVTRMSTIRRMA